MRFVQAGVLILGALIYAAALFYFVGNVVPYSPELANAVEITMYVSIAVWNVLLLIATVLVLFDSIRKVRAGKTRELAVDVFVVKLAAIPFFLLNYVAWAVVALSGLFLFVVGGAIFWVLTAVASGLTYVTMLSTSVYGWAAITRLRRDGRLEVARVVLYSILLCVFVADIVVGVLLYRAGTRHARVNEASFPL